MTPYAEGEWLHAPQSVRVLTVLEPLNLLSAEVLDGIGAHSWRIEPPPLPDRWSGLLFADRIAYPDPRCRGRSRAGVISVSDLPRLPPPHLGSRKRLDRQHGHCGDRRVAEVRPGCSGSRPMLEPMHRLASSCSAGSPPSGVGTTKGRGGAFDQGSRRLHFIVRLDEVRHLPPGPRRRYHQSDRLRGEDDRPVRPPRRRLFRPKASTCRRTGRAPAQPSTSGPADPIGLRRRPLRPDAVSPPPTSLWDPAETAAAGVHPLSAGIPSASGVASASNMPSPTW